MRRHPASASSVWPLIAPAVFFIAGRRGRQHYDANAALGTGR
jgi:hypothetical protein